MCALPRALLCLMVSLAATFVAEVAEAQHPHLYFDADALAAVRERIAAPDEADGWSDAELHAAYVAQADTMLARPFRYSVSIPDADGEGSTPWTYTLSSALPPPHPNNASYPPWTIMSRQLQSQLELLSFLYAIEGDERYLRNSDGAGAIDIALALSAWSTWNDPEYPCGGDSACLDTAHLTMGVALLYDLAYDALTEDERTTIRGALIGKGIFPLSAATTTEGPPHNIHAVRATALAVGGASVHTESGATPHFVKAHAALTHFIESQGADGGALEGNVYGAYAMDTIARAAIALESKSELPSLFEHPWVQGLPRFTAAFLGTDGTSVNFGDSSIGRFYSTSMFALASRGNAEAQWFLDYVFEGRPDSWLALMLARRELEPAPPLADPGGVMYPETGYAALRAGFDGAPVLAMKSGPTTERVGHNHFDHNSFVVSAFDQWLAFDAGYRDYFNVPRRNYTTGTVGHNTLMVDLSISADGRTVRGGQTELTGGQLRHFWEGAAYSRIIGEAAAAYPAGLLDRYTRRIYYARPDLFFVFDEVRAPAAHEYSFLLHTDPTTLVERVSGDVSRGSLPRYRAAGARGELHSFAVSPPGWKPDAPRVQAFPGVTNHAPYAEWRTNATADVAAITAVVPVFRPRRELVNPGFEDGTRGWTPRSATEDVSDESVQRSGDASGRVRRSGGAGYFYSSVIATAPGRTISGGAWVRGTGTGAVTLTPYFRQGAAYLPDPTGEASSREIAELSDWTFVAIPEQAAPPMADGVRLALTFNGDGAAYFDDAELHSEPAEAAPDPDPHAFSLGDPPAGIAVQTVHGVDVGVSFLGDPRTPADTALAPSGGELGEVQTDGVLALFGLSPEGELERAYLQTGTWLRVGGQDLLRAASAGGYDLRVEREGGCTRLYVDQVETLEGAPFEVHVQADDVVLDGAPVAFEATGEGVRFPVSGAPPAACEPAPPDAGGQGTDGSVSDADAGVERPVEATGCGCRGAGNVAVGNEVPAAAWLLGLGLVWLRGRRTGKSRRFQSNPNTRAS